MYIHAHLQDWNIPSGIIGTTLFKVQPTSIVLVELWYEALPTRAAADADERESHLERLVPVAEAGATGFLVPELSDAPIPAMDNLEFAAALHERTGLPVRIAILTASRTHEELQERIAAATAAGVCGFLMVGKSSSDEPARGPDVIEALHACDAECGVVTIPHRNRNGRESARLHAKQSAGARFAVTQILYDTDEALRTVHNLRQKGGEPLRIMIGIAPAQRRSDVRLLRALGVVVPPALDVAKPGQAAFDLAIDTARTLLADIDGPSGVCVSHITYSNIEAAIDLLATVREACAPLAIA